MPIDTFIDGCVSIFTFMLLSVGFMAGCLLHRNYALVCCWFTFLTMSLHVELLMNYKNTHEILWIVVSLATFLLLFFGSGQHKPRPKHD